MKPRWVPTTRHESRSTEAPFRVDPSALGAPTSPRGWLESLERRLATTAKASRAWTTSGRGPSAAVEQHQRVAESHPAQAT